MDEWIAGWMDEWAEGQRDERLVERQMDRYIDRSRGETEEEEYTERGSTPRFHLISPDCHLHRLSPRPVGI